GDGGDRLDGELVVVAGGDGLVVERRVEGELSGRRPVSAELAEQELAPGLGAGGRAERGSLRRGRTAALAALSEEVEADHREHVHDDEHVQESAAATGSPVHGQKMKLACEDMFRSVTSSWELKSRWPGTLRPAMRFSGLGSVSPSQLSPRL